MTTLFSNTVLPTAAPVTPKKHTWLPLLTVLFLISYGLMTMLIIEQGSTIESQRALIRELYRDSMELSAVKGKAGVEKNIADEQRRSPLQTPLAGTQAPVTRTPSVQTPSTQTPSAQAPLTQAPMTQNPSTQTPSSQAVPQQRVQSRVGKAKPQVQIPSKPASDLMDDRRALRTI
jgi:hypothetical protein